jgi:hypothetical protein
MSASHTDAIVGRPGCLSVLPPAVPVRRLGAARRRPAGGGDSSRARARARGQIPDSAFAASRLSPRGKKRYVARHQIDLRGDTFWKVEVLKFIALSEDERHQQTPLEWEWSRCSH